MTSTMGRAERQARWLLWQTGGVTVDSGEALHTPPPPLPEPPETEIRRSRYNAVIRRMQQAGQRTGAYSPVS